MRGCPQFSFLIPTTLAKTCFSGVVIDRAKTKSEILHFLGPSRVAQNTCAVAKGGTVLTPVSETVSENFYLSTWAEVPSEQNKIGKISVGVSNGSLLTGVGAGLTKRSPSSRKPVLNCPFLFFSSGTQLTSACRSYRIYVN